MTHDVLLKRRKIGQILKFPRGDNQTHHPFSKVLVAPSDIRSNVSSNGITVTELSMRIKLSATHPFRFRPPLLKARNNDDNSPSVISLGNIQPSEVSVSHDLHVEI